MSDLLLRRRIMMAGGLPAGYTKLSYLESSGTQYIDTGLVTNSVDRAKFKGSFVAFTTIDYLVGGRPGSTATGAIGFALYGSGHGGLNFYPMSWQNSAGVPVAVGQVFEVDSIIKDGFQSFAVDGVTTFSDTASLNISSGSNKITIFGLGMTNSADYVSSARCYGVTLYYNDSVVFNGIPARRESDQVLGIFDTVTKTFLTNAGTGSFTGA